jgi:hypothetical protein
MVETQIVTPVATLVGDFHACETTQPMSRPTRNGATVEATPAASSSVLWFRVPMNTNKTTSAMSVRNGRTRCFMSHFSVCRDPKNG